MVRHEIRNSTIDSPARDRLAVPEHDFEGVTNGWDKFYWTPSIGLLLLDSFYWTPWRTFLEAKAT